MSAKKILVLLGSSSDKVITDNGIDVLKKADVNFSLRIASAHRTPQLLEKIVKDFEDEGGKIFICVAGKSAHLAGVVASHTTKPVIAVPVYGEATAGFDALLSMSQMPAGIPVATMTIGSAGFTNACLFALQILSLSDAEKEKYLHVHRESMKEKVEEDDRKNRI
jgi:phosphoribosylaminoimidazole carboxylase PurE protein